jgi:OOP family OmpA-OmpF porin
MRSHKIFVAAVSLALASTAAHAQFYVGGGIGSSQLKGDNTDVSAPLVANGLSGTIARSERDTGYKVYAGYDVNKNVAVEFGYTDLGKATYDYSAPTVPATAQANSKVKGYSLAVLGKLPVSKAFTLFAKLGAFNARTDMTYDRVSAVVGNLSISRSDSKTTALLGIGTEYAINEKLKLRAEYEDYGNVGSAVTQANTNNPQGTGRARATLFSLSLSYGF